MIIDKEISLIPVNITDNVDLLLKISSRTKYSDIKNINLLLDVIAKNKYSDVNKQGVFDQALPLLKHAWIGHTDKVLAGIILLCYFENTKQWTLDAYKDDKALKDIDNRADFSYRTGILVLNWFFNNKDESEIYTMHYKENRGATLLCKRLGFRIMGYANNSITVLKLERSVWENRRN